MPVNLLNEQDLNDYILRVVMRMKQPPKFSIEQLRKINFVENNIDLIAEGMVLQWMKHRIRRYFTNKSGTSFLKPIELTHSVLPQWAIDNIKSGKEVYEFNSNRISINFLEKVNIISQFLKKIARNYINRQLAVAKQENTPVKLRLDHLKTSNQYYDFDKTYEQAQAWEIINANRTNYRYKKKEKKQSEIGTQKVMDLPHGYYVVQLLTEDALNFEAKYMNHCIKDPKYYDKIKSGAVFVYSIRDFKGEPHVTIEVYNNAYITFGADLYLSFSKKEGNIESDYFVRQCRGKNDAALLAKYIPYAQQFIFAQNYGFIADMKHAGLIYKDGQYWDIFNLPKGFIIKGDLDLSDMQLTELPDLSTVTVEGSFNCAMNKLTSLKGAPRKVGKNFICSSNKITSLEGGPIEVGGCYSCFNNKLQSLKGCARFVGEIFDCRDNNIQIWNDYPQSFSTILFNEKCQSEPDEEPISDEMRKMLSHFLEKLPLYGNEKTCSYAEFQALLPKLQRNIVLKSRQQIRDDR